MDFFKTVRVQRDCQPFPQTNPYDIIGGQRCARRRRDLAGRYRCSRLTAQLARCRSRQRVDGVKARDSVDAVETRWWAWPSTYRRVDATWHREREGRHTKKNAQVQDAMGEAARVANERIDTANRGK